MELALVGPTNRLASRTFDPSRSVNWFEETIRGVGAKAEKGLRYTAGVYPRYQFGNGPTTADFYQDGRAFAVNGTSFAELFDNYSSIVWGTVAFNASYRASICSNGSAGGQLLVTSGGSGYVFDLNTNTLSAITDPNFPANVIMGEFFGGYGFVLVLNSRTFYWSDLEDFTSWPALNKAQRSWGSDNISFLKRVNTQIWIGGTETSEVWYATGGTDVFAPIQGALLDFGCIANFSVARYENSLAWLSQDERGGGQIIIAKGYTPDAISTYPIDVSMQSWQTSTGLGAMNSTVGFAMQLQGHVFYWASPGFNNDTATTTPVFDASEQAWHEQALWDSTNCVFLPHLASTHMFAFEKHFVGDRRTGAIYELSPSLAQNVIVTP